MGNQLSLWCGHDATATFYNAEQDKYHIIELERLYRKRYFRLHVDNDKEQCRKILLDIKNISENILNIKNNYDFVSSPEDGRIYYPELIYEVFNTKNYFTIANHHEAHAAAAFYQSPFERSIVISYDGGGNDGYFNVYRFENNQIEKVLSINSDFGGAYMLCASCIKEVANSSKTQLSLPGKLMGLCGYGKPSLNQIEDFCKLFENKNDQIANFKYINHKFNFQIPNKINPWDDILTNATLDGEAGYNFGATIQEAFERSFFEVFNQIIKNFPDYPVCITGGAALNVLVNQKIKDIYKVKIFVPPNPNDCGLALGELLFFNRPEKKVNVTYNGVPLLDKNNFKDILSSRKVRQITLSELAKILKSGKIVGICQGDSEVGPRALGNRSIICDPSYPDMKNILNSKVKFREWYRPFAPFCKKDEAHEYFESNDFDYMEYMGFAPKVKKEKAQELPSITHIDGTARLQTVTKESHTFFYELLTEFGKISTNNVLLNTSFNIKGKPILTTIDDALYVLDNTQLDCVYSDGYLFEK